MIKNREGMPWHKISVFKFARENNSEKTFLALQCVKDWFFSIKRKDGRWEFMHSYRVGQILIFHGVLDDDILAAIILHDVLENISPKLEEIIRCLFGERVALIVWVLSRRPDEDNKFYFARIWEDFDFIICKLGDRLHNLRNMKKNLGKTEFFTLERLQEQIDETWEYIVPLAVKAARISCKYRQVVVEIHEEILRSLADAEWAITNC